MQKKFAQKEYKLQADPVPLRHIWTASEAQMALMTHTARAAGIEGEDLGIPFGAKVFVLAGGAGFWLNSLRMKDPLRFDSWDLRTTLSEEEAKMWAAEARESLSQGKCNVYVCMFSDGQLDSNEHNASHHGSAKSRGYKSDWGFELVRNVSYLLHHGARIYYTADDAFNPSVDASYPGMVFPQPGPGMFAAMMTFLLGPARQSRAMCAGKGGSHGKAFMMEHAIQMLIAQGHSGDKSKIMMIGDRYDTDVRAGNSVGVRTCLVQSGAHQPSCFAKWPGDKADWTCRSVGHLIPVADRILGSPSAASCATPSPRARRSSMPTLPQTTMQSHLRQQQHLNPQHVDVGNEASRAPAELVIFAEVTTVAEDEEKGAGIGAAAQVPILAETITPGNSPHATPTASEMADLKEELNATEIFN